ncbi:MAG: hypothetical protein JSS02_29920, partial [Planctomycetes bacterium]|nr:hypothetical protein [Planctomycetota bacterium]
MKATSDDPMIHSLLDTLDMIRTEVERTSSAVTRLSNHQIHTLLSILENSNEEWVLDIRQQILKYRAMPDTAKNLFFRTDHPGIFAAFFSGTDFKSKLGFEFASFEKLRTQSNLRVQVPSNATPIWLQRTSSGLVPLRVVALFPENWQKNLGRLPGCDEPVLYFIDRFVKRYFQYSVPTILIGTAAGSFVRLKELAGQHNVHDVIRQLSVDWMWLHESCHHLGCLPLPEFLRYKNTRSAGAVEEMRADVLALLELSKIHIDTGDFPTRELLTEFILAERL